jgi:hypothetical protein
MQSIHSNNAKISGINPVFGQLIGCPDWGLAVKWRSTETLPDYGELNV